ncbi:MAG: zinc ribbon domain-containing protein [Lachnospiraceae bacterium]|nr:zinc ribbon domain-containing protein [Lachnospiraceae bacterium]
MPIYNFCPKCGSVTKEGVCDSCGFVAPDYEPDNKDTSSTQNTSPNPFADAISANSGVFPSSSTDNSVFAPKEEVITPVEPVAEAQPQSLLPSEMQNDVKPQVQPVAQSPVQPQIQPQIQPQVQPQIQPQVQPQIQPQVQPVANVQNPGGQYYSQNQYVNGYANQSYNGAYPNGYYAVPVRQKKSLSTGAIIAIVIGSVLLFFALCAGIVFAVYSLARSGVEMVSSDISHYVDSYNSSSSYSFSFDPYDNISDEDFDLRYGTLSYPLSDVIAENEDVLNTGNILPLSNDPYDKDKKYYDFDMYYDESVPYKVSDVMWYYNNSDGQYDSDDAILPHDIEIVCHYFALSDTGLPNEDELNKEIFKASAKIADLAEDSLYYTSDSYSIYAENRAYITYMDENVLSIAFYPTAYQQSDYDDSGYSLESYLNSINIDMTTGRILKATEEFDFTGDFYQTFKDKCNTQNGVAIDYYSDDELKDIFKTDDVFWVYTPIGLEVGINRPSYMGWSTCTFLDYTDLIRSY